MSKLSIPLTILGGSDRKASRLPPSGVSKRPLTGCKGVDLRIHGIPLVSVIAEKLAEVGFGPIYIAGPAAAYKGVEGAAEVFDTDGPFGSNIRVGVESMRARHPEGPLAMATCDILPKTEEVELALDDYRAHAPSDLWFPAVPTPVDQNRLGESAWKPRYRIPTGAIVNGEREAIAVLPSHLAIFDPDAMRLRFVYQLLETAYNSRNRPVLDRRAFVVRKMLTGILYRDLLNLVGLRLPTLTWDTVVHGSRAALKLHRGKLEHAGIEDNIRRIFTRREHRKAHPERKVRVPFLEVMSLARDIDTIEEASSLGLESAAMDRTNEGSES